MYFEKIGEVGNGFGGNCDVFECDEINALPNAVPFSRAFIYSDEGIDVAMHSSKGFWVDTKGNKKFDTFIPEVISENGTVTFTKDGEELEKLTYGDTVTVTVTADSGYQVKTITLNGEEIENGAEITVDGDILLIAEFEEAPVEDVIWEDDVTFTAGDEGGAFAQISEAFPAFDKINTTDTYKVLIPDSDFSYTGKFENYMGGYQMLDMDVLFEFQIAPEGTNFYEIAGADIGEGTHHVKLVKSEAPAPSGYTWDGTSAPEDVSMSDEQTYHKVSGDILTAEQLVGATIVHNVNDEDDTYTVSADDISEEGGAVSVSIASDYSRMAIISGDISMGDITFNGTYFEKIDADGNVSFVKSLTLAE